MKHKPSRCPCARASERASESESEKRREKERERALLEANVHNGRPLRGPLTEERWSVRETERERESVCVCVCVCCIGESTRRRTGRSRDKTDRYRRSQRMVCAHQRQRGVCKDTPDRPRAEEGGDGGGEGLFKANAVN